MAYALIDPFGRVVEIASVQSPRAAALQWVDISAVTPVPVPGWTYANGAFTAPVLATLSVSDQAKQALDASDVTVLRCIEHAVAVPADWVTYRAALRAILAGGSATMPTRPAFPAGT